MFPRDAAQYCWQAISRYRFRSAMVLLAISLGVASVVVFTALGEGARRYVFDEFSYLGADVLAVFPGRNETTGGLPPVTGTAARDITLDEAYILQRRLSAVEDVAPVVIGSADVSFGERAREVLILGSSAAFVDIRQLEFAEGKNIRSGDIRKAGDDCLIGETLRREILGSNPAVGASLRVADYRCRVVGVLAGRGDAMGMDLSDAVLIPVAAAQRLFNTPGLFRLIVKLAPGRDAETSRQQILALMKTLHQGEEDVTVVSPDAMLSSLDGILRTMNLGVAAIASISLLVAGVLIMNITLINVTQRTEEIGLLKALGASTRQVTKLFLLESTLSCSLGALLGLVFGAVLVFAARLLMPGIAFVPPVWAPVLAVLVAVVSGAAFAWVPVRRASALAPVVALQKH